jgi:imidazolonepropionase-like amidohydrolase
MPTQRAGGGGGQGAAPGGPNAAGQQAAASPVSNSLHPVGQQPEVTALDLLRPEGDAFTAAHSAGFTAALTAPASGIFVGQSAVISLRDGTVQDILVRSPVAMHVGFSTARAGGGGGFPNSLMGVFAALRQMLLDAQHYTAEQAAYAANPRGMRRPANDPSLAALQPALARRMPVVMTANTQREIERALDLAREFELRPIIAGGQEAYKIAARLKAENVPVLLAVNFPQRPTTPRSPDADPEPLRVLRERAEAPRSPARLVDAGVRVAFQSGGGSAYGEYLGNVQRAVENGMSREQALRAMTLTPAELLGVADRLGTIETGKIANLTLVRGDVFDRGARVVQLFVDGRPMEVRAPAATNAGAAAATATGAWTVTVTLDGKDHAVTVGLQQTGEQLRGTLQGALGTGQIANGSIGADGELRFTATITLPAGTEEATFTGTLTGNTMRGTVTIVGHDPGSFVGTRPNDSAPARAGRPDGAPRTPPQR